MLHDSIDPILSRCDNKFRRKTMSASYQFMVAEYLIASNATRQVCASPSAEFTRFIFQIYTGFGTEGLKMVCVAL
jgi:hypothetical protein